ncbi:MAG: pyruvate carboxylase subunit B [Oscillospiraceae bacterium]|nr:pyruvate carboxylase subunit B [Oscillospiraceae bacterium]
MKKVQFTETVLRDASQSLVATRMSYEQFKPILETIDKAGYYSVECWGGATFDVCLRYLNEDPWERLRKIREAMPNTKLQMLLRGQNILGYKHYPDDIVRRFVRASVRNGIDIIRIFDALNDTNNLKVAIEETVKSGAIASGAISYTTSPVHTHAKYVEIVKELREMGASTICIKDMAGIMSPKEAYDLVSAIKDAVDLPVIIHTHCTTGLAFMTELKAIEAGADVIDTAISPFSGGTSQPATETLNYTLKELGYETGLNDEALFEMANFFKPIRADFLAKGTLNPISMATDTQCLTYQIPGGMLSNLLSQLKMMNALDRFDEALLETPRVREDMGYPPLVTPTSQIIGTQAVQNVLAGERYKNVGAELKAYCRGEYGRTPAPINPEVREKILKGEKPIEGRYADLLPNDTYEKTAEKLGDTARCEEDVLSYISFPQVAEKFFADRQAAEERKVRYSVTEIE